MEKVIANDLTKYIILLGAGVLGIGALTISFIAKARGSFKPFQKATLIYFICAVFFLAVVAVAAHPALISSPTVALLCFQAYFLLLGAAHVYFMNQKLDWSGTNAAVWSEVFFTLVLALAGCLAFVLLYTLFNKNKLELLMAFSFLFFIVPYFFFQAYRAAIALPPKIIKEWFYPVGEEIDEPEDSQLRNTRVISFEFQKKTGDSTITNFRAKAPVQMDFGRLFYYFLNDYNERNPMAKVQYVDNKGEPYGWVFYKRNDWYHLSTRYVDAEQTVTSNNIEENDVIICVRTLI
jgi:Type VI secretion system, TssN